MEILKQPQYSPQSLEDLTASLSTIDHVLDLPTADLGRFESELLVYLKDKHPEVLAKVRESRDLDDETREQLGTGIGEFQGIFRRAEG